ncbi:hypothetical protein [Amycolatopsis sp. ATCC 39116]|uniref:hypothetical protein n=1 Tax=Amycolatopsis sp. (strain ATCC 39116 / 75iv2) TaxID=385957 RepID=UPI0012F7C161|nr:hypothetical protein [Amycolatopsis sp. ATCC 39116]
MVTRGKQAGKSVAVSWRAWLWRWGPSVTVFGVALVAYVASGDPWPWVYALGVVLVLAVLGARKRLGPVRTAAVGVAVADVLWLSAVPWWGWLLAVGILGLVAVAGLVAVRRLPAGGWQAITAGAVAGAMVVAGGVGWIVDARARAAQEALWAAQQHQENLSRILPTTPEEALRTLHSMIAQNRPDRACGLFDIAVQAQVARDYGAPTCEAALAGLRGQVLDGPAYADVRVPEGEQGLEGDVGGWVNGCAVSFEGGWIEGTTGGSDPGPRLGQLHLHRVRPPSGGMIIDWYTPCPPEPGPRTGPLPTDPGDVADVLVDELAGTGDPATVCRLFSPEGAGEFAEVYATPDCPAAVTAFRARIVDRDRYRRVLGGAKASPAATDGSVAVDACSLRWSMLIADGPQPPPGPQLGRLTVAAPPGQTGYWITGYQVC